MTVPRIPLPPWEPPPPAPGLVSTLDDVLAALEAIDAAMGGLDAPCRELIIDCIAERYDAPPKVVHLAPGVSPDPLSRDIQVYESPDGSSPRKRPKRRKKGAGE